MQFASLTDFHSDLNKSNHYYKRAKIKNNYCIREHSSESE